MSDKMATKKRSLYEANGTSTPAPVAGKSSRGDFVKAFPALVQDVLDDAKKYDVPQNAMEVVTASEQDIIGS